MATLLYLQASPRHGRSHSLAVADAFLEAYVQLHPQDTIDTLDLFALDLPPFDGLLVNAKYNILHGRPQPSEEAAAWKQVEALIAQFKDADKYVLASPMWNFGIPYRLKQYLDILVQPTYTFGYTPESGYFGLVTGKPIFVALARGGAYPPGSPAAHIDFQKPYLDFILRFIGFTDIRWAIVEPTLEQGPETAQARRQEAITQARKLAADF
ncbi:MAG: FMN-dependent NADH-azoreductase [Deltaproteobacteria bacterium]|nr:FMN-dependent NADH-azoreductase [Deltaproteobacteria bacterium]